MQEWPLLQPFTQLQAEGELSLSASHLPEQQSELLLLQENWPLPEGMQQAPLVPEERPQASPAWQQPVCRLALQEAPAERLQEYDGAAHEPPMQASPPQHWELMVHEAPEGAHEHRPDCTSR